MQSVLWSALIAASSSPSISNSRGAEMLFSVREMARLVPNHSLNYTDSDRTFLVWLEIMMLAVRPSEVLIRRSQMSHGTCEAMCRNFGATPCDFIYALFHLEYSVHLTPSIFILLVVLFKVASYSIVLLRGRPTTKKTPRSLLLFYFEELPALYTTTMWFYSLCYSG